MKKICTLILLAALLLIIVPLAEATDNSVFRSYGKGYQYVLLGNYPYDSEAEVWGNDPYSNYDSMAKEPVLWRILSVEDNTLLLLTEYVIELQQVTFISDEEAIKKYDFPKLENYYETDLCRWMNEEMLPHLFGQDPIVNALMEEGENGRLFCLTAKQFEQSKYGFRGNVEPTKVRVTSPTPYARKRRIYRDNRINYKEGGTPYWVGTMMTGKSKLHIVGYDGHISGGVYSRDNIGLRPGVRLSLDLIGIESGTGDKKDPFILKYTGELPTATPEPVPEPEKANSEPESVSETEQSPEAELKKSEKGKKKSKSTSTAPVRQEGTALVSFLGDCSIGDAYPPKGDKSYHAVVDREGYAWPFSLIQQYIGTDDMTVANLEVVITTRKKHKNIMFPLQADPDHTNILLEGSVDVVNTANNHCYDFYRDGYADTLQALDDAGIDHFGSVYYNRKNGFDDIVIKDVNGIRIGMLGFTYPSEYDQKHAEKLIKQLREEQHCDYIIVSLHWGREEHLETTRGYAKMGQKFLDLGADMIYGHHPHVLQPIGLYKNKPILFSTGNCTFGTLSNVDKHAGIFQLTLEKTKNGTVPRKLEVIPCKYYKTGDYRIEEEKDEAERLKTFQILSKAKNLADCVSPPASFLDTGVILFNEKGEVITGE